MTVVLSLFPGIGLLDRGFELEGYTVVRGPDPLWGGDITRFHVPERLFTGVIGGPPCQTFSKLAWLVRGNGYETRFGNLIPEFERVVAEAQPDWFVMENVPEAPSASVPGYIVYEYLLNNRWFTDTNGSGASQDRTRLFSFGARDGRRLTFDIALTSSKPARAVLGGHAGGIIADYHYEIEEACTLQGLPLDYCAHMPFTKAAKLQALANGVPIPMGRAVARAVRRAMGVAHASAPVG